MGSEVVKLTDDYQMVLEGDIKGRGYKFMLVGIPEIGLVGILALRHLVKDLNMKLVGYILSDFSALTLRYENGSPVPNIRLYEHGDILVLIVETAVTPMTSLGIAKMMHKLFEYTSSEFLVMLGSAPSATRDKKALDDLLVLGAPIGDNAQELLKTHKIEVLKNGTLSGPYAYIMNNVMRDGKNAFVLLTETFPAPIAVDPESAARLLKALSPLLGVDTDIRDLLERGEEIKLELRKLERLAAPAPPKEIGQLYT
ncbi:MAG: proteasome assembly chaperone family protein [Candidatus Njordarchaeia archaeon]